MAIRVTRAGVALTVGIILLAGLIVGGLFWAKGLGEQARHEEAMKVAEQALEEQSNKDVALNEADKDKSGDESTNETPATGSESPVVETDELPQTGPADTLLAVLVVALLAFISTSYLASRKHLATTKR